MGKRAFPQSAFSQRWVRCHRLLALSGLFLLGSLLVLTAETLTAQDAVPAVPANSAPAAAPANPAPAVPANPAPAAPANSAPAASNAANSGAESGTPTATGAAAGTTAATSKTDSAKLKEVITRGLDWLVSVQARSGRWTANNGEYPTAMTALAVLALTAEGSTTMQGKYALPIRHGVDFLLAQSRPNGLIGSQKDNHYTYGHGYAMLALAQVLGEEEDIERRQQLVDVLERAVSFTVSAQTKAGGWGYVSAKDGNDFDEGSTTITQVQGLRACRNAGIPVPKEAIDKAIQYINHCTHDDGGVQYSSKSGGPGRPAITAAAIACLFNAGDYDDKYVPKMLEFCRQNLSDINGSAMGYWHYTHFYYAQVMYRQGGEAWQNYSAEIFKKLLSEVSDNGCWSQGYIGGVYTTSKNLVILQMDQGNLPIFQR